MECSKLLEDIKKGESRTSQQSLACLRQKYCKSVTSSFEALCDNFFTHIGRPLAQELKGLREGDDAEDGAGEEGVTFNLWKKTEQPPPTQPVFDEVGCALKFSQDTDMLKTTRSFQAFSRRGQQSVLHDDMSYCLPRGGGRARDLFCVKPASPHTNAQA